MNELKTLIDLASKVCKTDANLAVRMDIAQSVISDMRHRGRTISPETAAELADIAGLDPRDAAVYAMLVRSRGTRREKPLLRIFGKPVMELIQRQKLPAHSVQGVLFRATPSPKGSPPEDCFLVR